MEIYVPYYEFKLIRVLYIQSNWIFLKDIRYYACKQTPITSYWIELEANRMEALSEIWFKFRDLLALESKAA